MSAFAAYLGSSDHVPIVEDWHPVPDVMAYLSGVPTSGPQDKAEIAALRARIPSMTVGETTIIRLDNLSKALRVRRIQ